MKIKVSDKHCKKFFTEEEYALALENAEKGYDLTISEKGPGNDFLGWKKLPSKFSDADLKEIEDTAKKMKSMGQVLIVIGIGGSFLGAQAAVEALKSFKASDGMEVYFAGNNMCSSYYSEILSHCEGKDVVVNIVSKSGSTTETAIAFRIFRSYLEKRYHEGAKERIIVTTGRKNSVLREIAEKEGYATFPVPEDVGGRYSVLSEVGLLPIACAGIDIREMIKGAHDAEIDFLEKKDNSAIKYAALRNLFYKKDKVNEIVVTNRVNMKSISAWFQQLFAESEGKDKKGILPVPVFFTSDLHSVGQYIQDGMRNMFETVMEIEEDVKIDIPTSENDGFPFLDGKSVGEINEIALTASVIAHEDGGVPVIRINLGKMTPANLGYIFYFFECACAVSAYTLGVNPFNQPAVEEYKKNMFALLGKKGYEELAVTLKERLK